MSKNSSKTTFTYLYLITRPVLYIFRWMFILYCMCGKWRWWAFSSRVARKWDWQLGDESIECGLTGALWMYGVDHTMSSLTHAL